MPTEIVEATTDDDYADFGRLITTYEQWLRECYASVPDLVNQVREHQNLDAELADLRHKYGPPHGVTLLARTAGDVTGGVAYRALGDGTCEMKRLFVLDASRGTGLGRRLCRELIDRAEAAGFTSMRLDTGFLNTDAIALYTALGFGERDAYCDYPLQVMPYLRFYELALGTTTA
jgi:GNAT superfamily N-acetyltransferase